MVHSHALEFISPSLDKHVLQEPKLNVIQYLFPEKKMN